MVTNLIDLWLAVETATPGYNIAAALADLNDACGTRYGHNKVSDWRRGVRQPNAAAQAYMRQVVIAKALREALGEPLGTYTDRQLDRLATLLSPPEPAP